ncbi:D-ribose ABC transporter substrate-binding protein [Salinicoccus halodurans]|uniref:D-ribose transporter subunit RbsB n=1 Tax=Salinicoccus halodurans TaxID=407035 RepID=A0A0F7HL37_9STAP|nr:D-ribose ABC transporter substrate-binding protein [Salinicoccus halodurans]AKG73532.1 D-ribose transporter subunit RbsB [Salinicoccus halodurans]SFK52164.1 ribose-binding protein [Salinicoccus halodurans]
MKRLLLFFSLLVFVAGCSLEPPAWSQSGGSSGEDGNVVIGVSVSTLNNPFFVTLKDGIEAAAQEKGYEVKVVDAQDDSAKQVNDIADLMQQGIDYLVVNPTDSAAISSSVESANGSGIPVITLDRSVESGEVAAFIASDNVTGGEMGAQFIVDELGEGAKVAELEGVPGASATRERGEGFTNVAEESLDVVTSQTANFNRSEGLNVTQNILQANPEIEAIFSHNDEMALGAVEAAPDDVLVVGFDGSEDALNSVENGGLDATVAQQPDLMGETAVETVEKLVNGEDVEEEIKVELTLEKQE